MVCNLLLVALQIEDWKHATPFKRRFLKILRRATFRKIIMQVLEFSIRVIKCRKFSWYLTKKWFHHKRYRTNFEDSRNTTGTHLRGNCLKETLRKDLIWVGAWKTEPVRGIYFAEVVLFLSSLTESCLCLSLLRATL